MAAITTAAIGVAAAGYQVHQGAQQKKEAKDALKSFERQDLDNAFEDLPISTIGSEIMQAQNSGTVATVTDAARGAGARGVFAAIPRIQAESNNANKEIQGYLDKQVQERNLNIARDNQRIRGIQENRDNNELQGIGQLMETGEQNMWSGGKGIMNSLMGLAGNIDSAPNPQVDSVGSVTPEGLKPTGGYTGTSDIEIDLWAPSKYGL